MRPPDGPCHRVVWSDWRDLSGEPKRSLHVVDDIGQADLGSGAGNADGADKQAHRPFLAGEDMLDRGAHLGLSIVGAGDAPRHRLALRLLAMDLRAQETVGEILL